MRAGRVPALGAVGVALLLAAGPGAARAVVAGDGPAAGRPRCYGAASRDPARRCHNRRLRLLVSPTPTQALLSPIATCGRLPAFKSLHPCRFGFPESGSRNEVVLVGDSHAGHWRAAVRYVAQQRRWRGTSITRSGCAFSNAARVLPEPARSGCRRWNADVVSYFRGHPELHTVFVSANSSLMVTVPQGRSQLAARVAGYLEAWRSLPASVTRIIVLRDVPNRPLATLDCVEAAIAAKRPAGTACAVPRAAVLPPDGEAVAAARQAGPRVQVADLTPSFCSPRLCFPVVGGALVGKDGDHMTTAFSLSLGPILLRRVAHLGPYRGEHPPTRAPTGATGATGTSGATGATGAAG